MFGHLEAAGIPALVVNALMKNVPGRQEPMWAIRNGWRNWPASGCCAEDYATSPKDLRELRIVSRYLTPSWTGMLAGERTAVHKLLDDAGIKLGGVVADIDGVCSSKMVEGLIAEDGQPGRTCGSRPGQGQGHNRHLGSGHGRDLGARHRLVLDMAYDSLRYLEGKLAALDRYLLAAMQPYALGLGVCSKPFRASTRSAPP